MIDLHGVRHEDVIDIIVDACSKMQTPFVVITGKSKQMKKIVSHAAAKFGLSVRDSIENPGRVVVDESR